MNTTNNINRQRTAHHKALEVIATNGKPGLSLWRSLRRIEAKASKYALRLCAGPELTEEQQERTEAEITQAVAQALGTLPAGFLLNRDPRGYALKLDPEAVKLPEGMRKDWGGYGLLAPEIN